MANIADGGKSTSGPLTAAEKAAQQKAAASFWNSVRGTTNVPGAQVIQSRINTGINGYQGLTPSQSMPTPSASMSAAVRDKLIKDMNSKNPALAREAGMAANFNKPLASPVVTPAAIAAIIKKPSLTANALASRAVPAQPQAFGAMDLYADPASMYDPAMAQIQAEKDAANQRYAKNQASIKNIFGALSDLSAKDSLRIQDQFKTSIASQQANLAERTAAANAGSAAGVAQAEATGAERGAGPEMASNPLETATAEGIARSNEYQTTWEALQNANASQAIVDTTSRQTGYGQQQVGALQQLQQNLEDKLLQLGGNETAVQQDIAKARYAAQQQVRDTLYSEAQQQAAAKAAAAAASARSSSATTKAKTYPKSVLGLQQQVTDVSGNPGTFTDIQDAVSKAAALVTRRLEAKAKANPTSKINTNPTRAQIIGALNEANLSTKTAQPGEAQEIINITPEYVPFAIEYVNKYSGLK